MIRAKAYAAIGMTLFSMASQSRADDLPKPAAVTPAFFTGGRLLEICSQPNYGQCSMYVAGVVDGVFFSDGENGQLGFCRAKLTNRGAAKLVLEELQADNTLRTLSAAAAVRAALETRLECPEKAVADSRT